MQTRPSGRSISRIGSGVMHRCPPDLGLLRLARLSGCNMDATPAWKPIWGRTARTRCGQLLSRLWLWQASTSADCKIGSRQRHGSPPYAQSTRDVGDARGALRVMCYNVLADQLVRQRMSCIATAQMVWLRLVLTSMCISAMQTCMTCPILSRLSNMCKLPVEGMIGH